MKKNVPLMVFIAILLLIPAVILLSSINYGTAPTEQDSPFADRLEAFTLNGIPFNDELLRLGRGINMALGKHEIVSRRYDIPVRSNGIFASSAGLMKNIDSPIPDYVSDNTLSVTQFADAMRTDKKQVYFMLLPTSGAIMQQNLPPFAQAVMVNQSQFIDGVYNLVSAKASTIDAYSTLFSKRGEYIYYRTENNLTSLGGFYVYSDIASKLSLGASGINDFDIQYTNNHFYGDLYESTRYNGAPPDAIALFKYRPSKKPFEYMVIHRGAESRAYHKLFVESAPFSGSELDVFLGGMSPVIDIRNSANRTNNLLVFGDKTAVAYLPFLANDCARITFVDLMYSHDMFEDVDPMEYDKILFAYSIETFMHTDNPAKVKLLIDSF